MIARGNGPSPVGRTTKAKKGIGNGSAQISSWMFGGVARSSAAAGPFDSDAISNRRRVSRSRFNIGFLLCGFNLPLGVAETCWFDLDQPPPASPATWHRVGSASGAGKKSRCRSFDVDQTLAVDFVARLTQTTTSLQAKHAISR